VGFAEVANSQQSDSIPKKKELRGPKEIQDENSHLLLQAMAFKSLNLQKPMPENC
jgi:hypothetical protein